MALQVPYTIIRFSDEQPHRIPDHPYRGNGILHHSMHRRKIRRLAKYFSDDWRHSPQNAVTPTLFIQEEDYIPLM